MIYVAQCQDDETLYKIGYSQNPVLRVAQFSSTSASKFKIIDIFSYHGSEKYGPEGMIHRRLEKHRATGLDKRFGTEVYFLDYQKHKKTILTVIYSYNRIKKMNEAKLLLDKQRIENPKYIAINKYETTYIFSSDEELLRFSAKHDGFNYFNVFPINLELLSQGDIKRDKAARK